MRRGDMSIPAKDKNIRQRYKDIRSGILYARGELSETVKLAGNLTGYGNTRLLLMW